MLCGAGGNVAGSSIGTVRGRGDGRHGRGRRRGQGGGGGGSGRGDGRGGGCRGEYRAADGVGAGCAQFPLGAAADARPAPHRLDGPPPAAARAAIGEGGHGADFRPSLSCATRD